MRDPSSFRTALLAVPSPDRDAWCDRVLGLDGIPDDGPELPRGGVPYLPCPVDALLRVVEHAAVAASDVFVDVGAGIGRATALVHLLTGARTIGLEIQPGLVLAARELAARMDLSRCTVVEGDAPELGDAIATGTVFLLYCPFGGARLGRMLDALETIARRRTIRVACVDLPLPACPWLTPTSRADDLTVYRSDAAG
jgi:hypothetical protein